jgi:hypothetical protein
LALEVVLVVLVSNHVSAPKALLEGETLAVLWASRTQCEVSTEERLHGVQRVVDFLQESERTNQCRVYILEHNQLDDRDLATQSSQKIA